LKKSSSLTAEHQLPLNRKVAT